MAKKVNYKDTEVEATISQAKILDELSKVGFSETGQLTKDGITTIMGGYKGANFLFKADINQVYNKLLSEYAKSSQEQIRAGSKRGLEMKKTLERQSIRVAWRHTYHYVNSVCACIHIGAIEMGHAFAGHLAIKDGFGNLVTAGSILTAQIEMGKVEPTHIFNPLAIENKNNK